MDFNWRALDSAKGIAVIMKKIEGVIFDLDGTLMDSMWIWEDYGEKFFIDTGIIPDEKLKEELVTLTLRQAAEHCVKKYNMDTTPVQLMDKINGILLDTYKNDIKTKPGVNQLLRRLKNYGVKMCVVTATDRVLAKSALVNNGIDDCIEFITTCTDTGMSKNTPDIYEYALERLGTPKEKTIVFEDAYHAVKTAKNANFTVVGVRDRWESLNEGKIKEQAYGMISDFYEAEKYFFE